MNNGWVKIHRKIFENPLWLSEPFTYGQAWIDLILLANHAEGYLLIRGNRIKVNRGQVGHSILTLSERWRWSRTRVATFLKLLEIEQQIVQQKSFISTVITITNYDKHQKEDSKSTAEKRQKDKNGNKTVQQTGQQKTTVSDDNTKTNDYCDEKKDSSIDSKNTARIQQEDTNKNEKKEKNEKEVTAENIFLENLDTEKDYLQLSEPEKYEVRCKINNLRNTCIPENKICKILKYKNLPI